MLPILIYSRNDRLADYIYEICNNAKLFEDWDIETVFCGSNFSCLLEKQKKYNSSCLYFIDTGDHFFEEIIVNMKKLRLNDTRGFLVLLGLPLSNYNMIFHSHIELMDYLCTDCLNQLPVLIKSCINQSLIAFRSIKNKTRHHFLIETSGLIYSIDFHSVYYITSSNHSHEIEIFTKKEGKSYQYSLAKVLKSLDKRFFQCHRCYIVNMDYITNINYNKKEITMINNKKIPIAHRRANEFFNKYLEYINRHNHLGYSSAISKNLHTYP